VRKVLELVEGQECILVGTLYKEMRLKPSILDEYVKDLDLTRSKVASAAKFNSPDDALVLEDEAARVKLTGERLPVDTLVSGAQPQPRRTPRLRAHRRARPPGPGVVVAVRGYAEGPTFVVTDVCYPPVPPQRPVAAIPAGAASVPPASAPDDVYLALASGLQVGAPGVDPLAATLLVEWLSGALGGRGEVTLASRVARVVLAGDLLCALPHVNGHLDAKAASRHAGPLREADVLLTQLAAALPVDLMPGRNDPSNAALPQQPLHACLLPQASRYATLARVTNPHEFELGAGEGALRVLGTSGQNVDDLYRCTTLEDRLALLAATLEWGHLAPSAPDTLACYPFYDRDPFQIRDAPHLLFAGNQPAYATAMHRAPVGAVTRLILVPSFATTGTIVLVNLRTLAPHPITFSTSPLV